MTKLETINAEDLQNRTYEPTPFLVDELIPEGLYILAGAPKIGKSWLALWLCLSMSAMIAKCSVGGASSVRSKSRVWIRWNESSRLRYSASPCVVAKFQSACPCATHKQSHKASHDLPIFGAPARICKPSGMSSSTRKCVGSYVLFCRSSAVMVSSLVIFSLPFRLLLTFCVA